MKVYGFTKGDRNTPSSRQRWFELKLFLQKVDPDSTYTEPFPDCNSFWKIPFLFRLLEGTKLLFFILRSDKTDIFFLQRPIYCKYLFFPLVLGLIIKRPKIVFDVDDAIYTHSYKKTRILTWLANVVLVGNHELLNWFSKYHAKVYLMPTSVDVDVYKTASVAKQNKNNDVVIGWVGSGKAHEENLKLLKKPLNILAKKYKFIFRIIGAQHQTSIHQYWKNPSNKFKVDIIDELNWSDTRAVPNEIADFTIGVMPLADTPFNRGKSSFKAIEYMACNKPVVISGVGENVYLIQNGDNGFLANSTTEWVLCISSILENPSRASHISNAARVTVLENYSYQRNSIRVLKLLRSL